MDFFEVANTQRAMRRLHSDPIPDADLWTILDAATKAPNGGNRQPWNFVVIRDAEAKAKIAAWYLEAWNKAYGGATRDAMLAHADTAKTYRSADYLANHFFKLPGGGEPTPEQKKAFATSWNAQGVRPAGEKPQLSRMPGPCKLGVLTPEQLDEAMFG